MANSTPSASERSSSPLSPVSRAPLYAMTRLPPKAQAHLYKTEMCRSWAELGTCRYGHKCLFAHGYDEMRHRPKDPRFRTTPCKTFLELGMCKYGARCNFSHISPMLQTIRSAMH